MQARPGGQQSVVSKAGHVTAAVEDAVGLAAGPAMQIANRARLLSLLQHHQPLHYHHLLLAPSPSTTAAASAPATTVQVRATSLPHDCAPSP